MFTPLAKLAIGLSATMATAFYYLAAAPLASAQYVCGPGNFSSVCGGGQAPSPAPPSPAPVEEVPVIESPAAIAEPVEEVPVVESPAPIADPVQPVPVVESPAPIADPVQPVPVVESPAPIADPVQPVPVVESPAPIADPVQPLQTVHSSAPIESYVPPFAPGERDYWANIYRTGNSVKPTAIPEPGTVVALLVTGAGILCSARKRNKQVRQQR